MFGLIEQMPAIFFESLIYSLGDSSVLGGWLIDINCQGQDASIVWWCLIPQIEWMLCNNGKGYTEVKTKKPSPIWITYLHQALPSGELQEEDQ